MNQQNQVASLTASAAPAAVISELSFCKTTARDLHAWLQQLPKVNTGEYSRLLFQALTELSKLSAAPELRIQLLEQLRPEVVQLTRQLEKSHLLSSVILNSRASKVANLCQTLQHLLTSGYKQVAADCQHERSGLLALAIQRTLHGLFVSLVHAYLTYRGVPAGLWFETHRMYRLAALHKLQDQDVKDPLLGSQPSQSLEQAYCCTLLLGSARANQMRQSDIQFLVQALPCWSDQAGLQAVDLEGSLFAVALATDTPPRYKALLNLAGRRHVLGLNTSKLAATIDTELKARERGEPGSSLIDEQVPTALLKQLASAWGDIAKRGFPRNAADGDLEACLGMSSVHYHLAGEQSFEASLQEESEPETTSEPATSSMDAPTDIWSMAIDAFHEGVMTTSSIEYSLPLGNGNNQEPDYTTLYPLLAAKIVNQSPGGYCLEWESGAPANLQTGDILALRKSGSESWVISTIRWIRQGNKSAARIGTEILAHHAESCGARLLRSGKAASNYLRALRIPEDSTIARPAQIITAKIPFHEGCTITLNINGKESRAILGRLVQQTASYNLFEYALKKNSTPSGAAGGKSHSATDRDKVNENEDFTSLWDLL